MYPIFVIFGEIKQTILGMEGISILPMFMGHYQLLTNLKEEVGRAQFSLVTPTYVAIAYSIRITI